MSVATGFTPEELEVRSRTTEQIVGEVREALRHGPWTYSSVISTTRILTQADLTSCGNGGPLH